MIAKMNSDQAREYQLAVAAMDETTLNSEHGRVASELANIAGALEELKNEELQEIDLSSPDAALDFLRQPPAQNNEALQAARIVQGNLQKQLILLNNERRGRARRAAYHQVATHLRENRATLEAAAAVVRENLALSGSLGIPAQVDAGFPLRVDQSLKFADSII